MKLVFIHGSGGSHDVFLHQSNFFPNSEALDLPGHPRGKPCTSVEGYVEWLRGYFCAKAYRDVVLAGHSLGGAITLLYALRYPEELKAIIPIATGAKLRVHPQYIEECMSGINSRGLWEKTQETNFAVYPKEVRDIVVAKRKETGPSTQLNDLLCCDKFDIMDQVHDIKLPTLTIGGSEDVMTPPKYIHYLASKIAGAKEVIIQGATHYVMLDKPKEMNAAIASFIDNLS